ncbi:MAG: MarR family transcriptional regulator [Planctomycetota bacterium]
MTPPPTDDRPTEPPPHHLACRIHALSREVTAATARVLEPYGVTPTQALLLWALSHGRSRPSAIAEEMGVDPSNLSRVIRAMADRGLLTRQNDPHVRTRVHLRLTPAGRRLTKKIDGHAGIIQNAAHAALSDQQLHDLNRMFDGLERAMRSL